MEKWPWSWGKGNKIRSTSPFPVPLQIVNLTQSIPEIADQSNASLITKADYQNVILDSWNKFPPPQGLREIVLAFTERAAFYYLLKEKRRNSRAESEKLRPSEMYNHALRHGHLPELDTSSQAQ